MASFSGARTRTLKLFPRISNVCDFNTNQVVRLVATNNYIMKTIDFSSLVQKDSRVAAAVDVAARLRSLGYTAYFAGGCVRDWLLGRDPKDIDIATDAIPYQTKTACPGSRFVGEAFGVSLVKRDGFTFEVATFRSDGDYGDGRRPDSVELHTSPEEDAKRRDFTINALFMDTETGEVIDYVDGVKDLEAGIIRAVGVAGDRFAEDHLRMLRAVRFASQLGFEIEDATLEAIFDNSAEITNVAKERVWVEMTKLLLGQSPDLGFRLLCDTGLFRALFAELERCYTVGGNGHGEVSEMLRLLVRYRQGKPDPVSQLPGSEHLYSEALCWAILFGKWKPIVQQELDKWPIPTELGKKIATLVNESTVPPLWDELSLADRKRYLRRPHLHEHLLLWSLAWNTEWRVAIDPAMVRLAVKNIIEDEIFRTNCEPQKSMSPPVLLDGNALQELGYSPGPLFSKMMAALEEEQLMERVLTREAAVEFIESNYSQ